MFTGRRSLRTGVGRGRAEISQFIKTSRTEIDNFWTGVKFQIFTGRRSCERGFLSRSSVEVQIVEVEAVFVKAEAIEVGVEVEVAKQVTIRSLPCGYVAPSLPHQVGNPNRPRIGAV